MEHDIITRDANSVSWAKIWECSKSQRDIIDAVTIGKIIVFEIICYAAWYSAAEFTFSIEQPSNKAAKYHISAKVTQLACDVDQSRKILFIEIIYWHV